MYTYNEGYSRVQYDHIRKNVICAIIKQMYYEKLNMVHFLFSSVSDIQSLHILSALSICYWNRFHEIETPLLVPSLLSDNPFPCSQQPLNQELASTSPFSWNMKRTHRTKQWNRETCPSILANNKTKRGFDTHIHTHNRYKCHICKKNW